MNEMSEMTVELKTVIGILVTLYILSYAFALATLLVLGVPEFGDTRKKKPQHPMAIIAKNILQKLLWIPIFVSPQLIFVALYIVNGIQWWNEKMDAYKAGYDDA